MSATHTRRYAVCAIEELPPGTRRIARIAGRSIGVFNVNGELFAIRNRCPHQGGPLCLGMTTGVATGRFVDGEQPELGWERDGEILRCPWHAWEFDLRSGNAVFGQGRRVAVYRAMVAQDGADAEPIVSEVEDLPPSLKVPPPLERYSAAVESGTVIVDLSPPEPSTAAQESP